MTTIKNGSKGTEVRKLQEILGVTVDGIFGPKTESAVKEFQNEHGLDADGIVGPKTWDALEAEKTMQDGIDTTTPPVTKSNITILIDNGHGINTPGKRSPDGRLREYSWCREIATRLVEALKKEGYNAERIVTEETDISLSERVKRVNNICSKKGTKNCILISIHINAASSGQWSNATGWSDWVAPNASANSKKLGALLYDEAAARGLKGNRSVPASKNWTGNFTIIKKTNCPAVLTENLFQDNKENVEYLLSEKGKQTIVDLHVAGIVKYINNK